jgi:hypothetical protein
MRIIELMPGESVRLFLRFRGEGECKIPVVLWMGPLRLEGLS